MAVNPFSASRGINLLIEFANGDQQLVPPSKVEANGVVHKFPLATLAN